MHFFSKKREQSYLQFKWSAFLAYKQEYLWFCIWFHIFKFSLVCQAHCPLLSSPGCFFHAHFFFDASHLFHTCSPPTNAFKATASRSLTHPGWAGTIRQHSFRPVPASCAAHYLQSHTDAPQHRASAYIQESAAALFAPCRSLGELWRSHW